MVLAYRESRSGSVRVLPTLELASSNISSARVRPPPRCIALFLYKTTRNLLGWTGDTGGYLRDTMKAMVLFESANRIGNTRSLTSRRSLLLLRVHTNYQAIQYYRLDSPGTTPQLFSRASNRISPRTSLHVRFTVYSSISQASATGKIPFPGTGEDVEAGMPLSQSATMTRSPSEHQRRRRTYWSIADSRLMGTSWGVQGYGGCLAGYVTKQLAIDWWSLIKSEWIDTNVFSL
jgi:hypothetical protein